MNSCMLGTMWPDALAEHKHLMDNTTYTLLIQQQKTFAQGTAPAIADQRVKQIPIVENHEPLVDLQIIKNPRIRVMDGEELQKAHTSPEDIDPRAEKYSYMRQGVYDALVRMVAILDELAPYFGYEPGELEIHLFEGLRDIATQKVLFDTLQAQLHKQHPEMTAEEAEAETSKWVSPYKNNVPVHSTGAAIDIHMWSNKKQNYCDMGRFNKSGPHAPTFSNTISHEQQLNRLLMLIAATRAGLTNYVFEFWHFSHGDRYASYWHGDNHARYNSI